MCIRDRRYTLYIENCHEHTTRIAAAITGRSPLAGDIAARNYSLTLEQIKAN